MQTLKKFIEGCIFYANAPSSLNHCHLPSRTLRIDALMSFSCCYLQREKKSSFMFWSLQVLCCYKLEKAQYIEYLQVNQLTRNKNHARSNLNVNSIHLSSSAGYYGVNCEKLRPISSNIWDHHCLQLRRCLVGSPGCRVEALQRFKFPQPAVCGGDIWSEKYPEHL